MMRGHILRKSRIVILQLFLASAMVGIWEYCSASKIVDPFFFSRPSEIVLRVGHWVATGFFWSHLLTTLLETILSFLIGSCLGAVLGFALGTLPNAAALLDPYIRVGNALPRVLLAPIFCCGLALEFGQRLLLESRSSSSLSSLILIGACAKSIRFSSITRGCSVRQVGS